jgi:two-component system LytT family sensor kinase
VEAQEVPFSRELEYLQLYLSIEQVRFQDRLRVEFAVDPETLDAAVPYMALQPIVENAIRHGIGRSSAAGRITITACGSGRRSRSA